MFAMKRYILLLLLSFFTLVSTSQEWMTNLPAAKRIAMVQNKMLLMIWEEASMSPYPVSLYDDKGNKIYVRDLFENKFVNELIWEHFVPVVVSEDVYADWYNELKGKRSVLYMQKFDDDFFKVMDVNGNILNTSEPYYEILNISEFIARYYLDTSYLKGELTNYIKQKDIYTTFRLAVKYIDISIYVNEDVKAEMIKLSNIYLDEAAQYLESLTNDEKQLLKDKIFLQELKQLLIQNRPRRVLRLLKKTPLSAEDPSNKTMLAFLNFTAHLLLKDETSAGVWRDQLTTSDIKKANLLVRQ